MRVTVETLAISTFAMLTMSDLDGEKHGSNRTAARDALLLRKKEPLKTEGKT
jgi:hypothetical protein